MRLLIFFIALMLMQSCSSQKRLPSATNTPKVKKVPCLLDTPLVIGVNDLRKLAISPPLLTPLRIDGNLSTFFGKLSLENITIDINLNKRLFNQPRLRFLSKNTTEKNPVIWQIGYNNNSQAKNGAEHHDDEYEHYLYEAEGKYNYKAMMIVLSDHKIIKILITHKIGNVQHSICIRDAEAVEEEEKNS